MTRTLTITFKFDDGPWIEKETGEEHPTDAIAYAMDLVNGSVPYANCDEFIEAKLDGAVLVDRSGYISDEVKQRERQCLAFKDKIASYFPNTD